MKKTNRSTISALLVVVLFLSGSLAVYHFVFRSNSDALWQIVSQQCVPSHVSQQSPGACLKVDGERQYVLFKDAKGPYHDLLMPTFAIAGLESSTLEDSDTPPFMALAWAERGRLADEMGSPISDEFLSLAINSRLGRSQNHLHIHIACLQATAKEVLARQAPGITSRWSALSESIDGKRYLAMRIAEDALTHANPFVLLNDHLRAQADTPGSYGLGMARLADGDFVLLATGRNLFSFDLGSIGKMQDLTCALAGKGAPR